MKNKKISKEPSKQKIDDFFEDIKNKTSSEIKKIKKLAMHNKISLKDNKKKFCKKCLSPYLEPKIRIKSGNKVITCENCGAIKRIKL